MAPQYNEYLQQVSWRLVTFCWLCKKV